MSVSYNFKEMRLAVVGCGNWGKNLIRVFHELGALGAICDLDPLKTAPLSEKYQVPAPHFEVLLADPTIHAIIIATPSNTHYELAARAIKANKHLYIEKPLTLELKQAHFLHQQALEKNRILMVGHLLQYHPVFNYIKNLKKDGKLGKIQYISSYRCNFGKFPGEKSVLWDFAPHDISMILALTDEMPSQVWANTGQFLDHTHTDTAHIHLGFSHTQAHLFVSWIHPYKEQKLIVVGTKAMVVFDNCQPWEKKLQLYTYPEAWTDGLPKPFPSTSQYIELPVQEPLFNECQHFLHCIQQHIQPLTNGEEAIKVMTVLTEAISAATEQSTPSLSSDFPASLHLSKQVNILSDTLLTEEVI